MVMVQEAECEERRNAIFDFIRGSWRWGIGVACVILVPTISWSVGKIHSNESRILVLEEMQHVQMQLLQEIKIDVKEIKEDGRKKGKPE